MWKAFAELTAAGWIQGKLPRLYSVQAAGCAPVVKAFEAGTEACAPWPDPRTIAAGVRAPPPLGGGLLVGALGGRGGGAGGGDGARRPRGGGRRPNLWRRCQLGWGSGA